MPIYPRRALACAVALPCFIAGVFVIEEARSQETRSALSTYNNNNITSNGQGKITGAIVNNMNGQFISSFGALADTNAWTGLNSFSAKTSTAASSASSTGLTIGVGVAPTSPNNGDIWVTSSGIYVQINGATVGPLGTGGGGGTPGGASGQTQYNNAGSFGGYTMSGDATLNTSTGALTLATVNSGPGSVGSSTAIPVLTTNGKGLVTAQSTAAVIAPAGTLTGASLASGVTGSSLTSVGTLTGGATGAGFTIALGSSTVTGQLGLANGGTNAALTASNGGIVYSGASSLAILAGTSTAGQCLLSGNLSAPTWGSCSGGGAAVSSVSNSDGTLTISPTTGAAVASLALSHANTWIGIQTFPSASITNGELANSTISGVALGSNLSALTFGAHLASGGTSYNGSAAVTITSDATNANTASTIVARDASGNFTAGTITAALTGTASNASALGGATFAAPGPIGSTTASTGAFTTLSASSTVSGAGFTSLFASPPAIGGTAAAAGAFTTLSATTSITDTALNVAGVVTNTSGGALGTTPYATAAQVQAGTSTTNPVTPSALAASAAFQTLTYGTTVNWNMQSGYNATLTLTGSTSTIAAPTNIVVGLTYTLLLVQDATGSRTTTFNAAFDFGTAGTPTLTTTANKTDAISCLAASTSTLYCTIAQGF